MELDELAIGPRGFRQAVMGTKAKLALYLQRSQGVSVGPRRWWMVQMLGGGRKYTEGRNAQREQAHSSARGKDPAPECCGHHG